MSRKQLAGLDDALDGRGGGVEAVGAVDEVAAGSNGNVSPGNRAAVVEQIARGGDLREARGGGGFQVAAVGDVGGGDAQVLVGGDAPCVGDGVGAQVDVLGGDQGAVVLQARGG